MKLAITPEAFSDVLAVAKSAVGNGKQIPAIGMVLVEASPDGGCTIAGTDLETRAWKRATCRVDEPGAACLPPDALSEFLAVCPAGGEITLAVNDKHKAELVCEKAQIKVAGLAVEDFPAATSFDDPSLDVTLSAPLLAELIGGVAHAVAPDRSHEVLAAINVRVRDGRLTLGAADGFRLAVRSAEVEGMSDLTLNVLGSALAATRRALATSTSARLVVDARESALLVDSEAGCWAIRLLSGQFPDFMRIVPTDPKITVTTARAGLLAAAKLARGIEQTTIEDGKRITANIARLTLADGAIVVRAQDGTGDHTAEVELDAEVEGEATTVGFNGRYLTDALAALGGDGVTIGLNGPASPAILTATGSRENMQIIMPMHVARPS